MKSGPLARRREIAEQRLRLIAGIAIALGIAAGAAIFLTRDSWRDTPAVIGKTYVLAPVSMRAQAAADAPPVKDLQASEILSITDYTIDVMGNRWFRVSSADVSGFVRTNDVAPPKSTDPEKGFEILRHSLMGLSDPEVLSGATQAVDFYRNSFPSSPHKDELRWLLAERTREMAERGRTKELVASARELYADLAGGDGEFADRARQALEALPTEVSPSRGAGQQTREPSEIEFSLVGGSVTPSRGNTPNPATPVRRVTVMRRTPLIVRLTQPAQLAPGAVFQGEFVQDVRVSREVAIPQGSSATGMVAQGGMGVGTRGLQLTGATVRGENYRVFAHAIRVDIPGKGSASHSRSMPSLLPAGTSIEFKLGSDLVITQR